VPQDREVAAQLVQRAADAGDPAAQADIAFRAALGVRPAGDAGFTFSEPDVPRQAVHAFSDATCHRFVAMASGTSGRQLDLGFGCLCSQVLLPNNAVTPPLPSAAAVLL